MESLRMLAHVLMLQFILSLTCRRLSVTQALDYQNLQPSRYTSSVCHALVQDSTFGAYRQHRQS